MSKKEIPADTAEKLALIQNKYDIFFKAHNTHFWDYFELQFSPCATLKIKAKDKLPFTLLNELKKDFQLIEK